MSSAPKSLTSLALITAATFTASALMMALTRDALPIACVWPANILAVILTLHRRDARPWAASAGALLGTAAAYQLWGDPSARLLGLAAANGLEVLVTTWLLQRWAGPLPWTLAQLPRALALSAVVGPLPGAALGAAALAGTSDIGLLDAALAWAAASMVGALLLLPAAWILDTAGEPPELPAGVPALLWGGFGASLLTPLLVPTLPLLSLPLIGVVYFAALGLARQAMLALGISVLSTLVATHLDLGPLAGATTEGRALGALSLQLYLATSALIILPICALSRQLQDTRGRLTEATQEAREANASKGAFLATMSRELSAPVSALLSLTHLLRDGPLNATQRSYVERIEAGSEHLQALVGEVLDLIHIDAGTLELSLGVVDLHALAYSSASLIAEQLSPGVDIRTLISGDVPVQVEASEQRVRQVLHTLLGNAAKHTPIGSVMLQLRAPADQPGCVEFIVRDTGAGIPEARLAGLLAEPDPGAPSSGKLGLRVTQKLVQAMGGALTLHSTVGIGTVARVSLPMRAVEGAPVPAAAPAAEPAPPELGLRVLIVDDDPVMGELVRIHLAHFGCEVVGCLDSDSALAQLSGERFDMLMTDLHMPGMDGPTLVRIARGRGIDPPHLVLMTADATPQVPALAERAGFHALLVKPVTQESLRRVMPGAEPAPPAPQQLHETPDLDEDMLEELLSIMGEAEFNSMLTRCFDRFLTQLADMDHAPVDRTHVQEFAHQVRGTAGNLAMARVRQIADRVETLTIQGQDYKPALSELRDALVSAKLACVDAGLLGEAPPAPAPGPRLRLIKDPDP